MGEKKPEIEFLLADEGGWWVHINRQRWDCRWLQVDTIRLARGTTGDAGPNTVFGQRRAQVTRTLGCGCNHLDADTRSTVRKRNDEKRDLAQDSR